MAKYATSGIAELERYINRQLLTPETIKAALKETAFFDLLNEKSVKKGGYQFEVSTRRLRTTDTAKTFIPWDTTTDFVGDSPAVYPVQTYTRKDPTRNMTVKMAFAHDNIRMNQFEIDALDTDALFVDYFDELSEEMGDNYVQFLAGQILRGLGDGNEGSTNGTASDMYGLYGQVVYGKSGLSHTAALTEATLSTNTHFGLGRHVFPHLVGRLFDAGQVDPSVTTKITIPSSTLTNGSTAVTFASTDLTTAARGWMVVVKSGATIIASGYEFRINAINATTAQTQFQMTQIFRGTTGSAYTVEIMPFFNEVSEGAANIWHVNKVYKVLASMADRGSPDIASVNSAGFYNFMGHMGTIQRWVKAEDADLKIKGFDNFKVGTCTVTVDEHEDAGRISFYNTKYTKLYWHKKYGMPKLKKNSLRQDPSGRGINSLIADMVMVGQPVCVSPKNCGAITGLPTF